MFRGLDFCAKWIKMMMMLTKTIRFKVLLNDILVGPILPTRGLRQWDPLSLFLFILCAEGFSALINKHVATRAIHGCKVARSAPIVSHLFFVDDIYLFF